MASIEVGKKKHMFTWKIENYSMCSLKTGEYIQSLTFRAETFDETTWYLELYPRGAEDSDDGYISCYLKRNNEDAVPFAIECCYMIEILNKDDNTVVFVRGTQNFEKSTGWGRKNFMKSDDLVKNALHNDTLNIRCTLCGNIPEKRTYSQNTGSTKFKVSKYSFHWDIKNLNSVTEQFKLSCSGSSQLEITVHILKEDVKICILIEGVFTKSKFMSCNFMLLDVEGKERDSRRETHLFESAELWEFPTFIKTSRLNAEKDVYIKDGCFSLQCDISVSDGSVVENMEESGNNTLTNNFTASDVETIAELNEDIKRMYADKIHADIKLKAGEEEFPAHKSILCSRSPVFMAMFDNDMAESQRGEVDIPDLDVKTVGLFLEYIYTGTVSELEYENVLKLIVAAEKYEVLSLKNKCANSLAVMLSDANVCEILVTADIVQHDILKASAINYIKMQPKKVFKLEEWKHCVKNNVLLATETATEVAMLLEDLAKEQSGK